MKTRCSHLIHAFAALAAAAENAHGAWKLFAPPHVPDPMPVSRWNGWTPGESAPYRNQRKARRLARQMGRTRV